MAIQASVVIPTYNRVKGLHRCLSALASQTLLPDQFEVIIVDDGSSDGTSTFLQSIQNRVRISLRCYHQSNQGPAAARNLGIQKAMSELVLFTDDDCIPASDWLESLLSSLPNDIRCTGVGGPIVRERDSLTSRYIDDSRAMQHATQDGQVLYLVTANALYRLSCLVEVGGFDTRICWPGGEDPDLAYRLRQRGYYLTTSHTGIVKHDHRDTIRGLYRMFWNHGRGNCARAQFGRRRPENPWWELRINLMKSFVRYIGRKDLCLYERFAFSFLHCVRRAGYHFGYLSCPDVSSAPEIC